LILIGLIWFGLLLKRGLLICVALCRGNAVTMKRMLETQFPGIDVVLANYPPSLPKRAVAKLVPVFQIGVVGIVLGGEQIFPMLGVRTPPWYYSLRANKFGTIASTWLLGNALQSFLQSSGAFEVYCDDELVSSLSLEPEFELLAFQCISLLPLDYLKASV